MRNIKSIAAFVLTVAMMCATFLPTAFALEDGGIGSGGEITWEELIGKPYIVENGVLTAYRRNDAEFVIPDGVVSVADEVFREKAALERVEMPDTLEVLGVGAFRECTSLKSVTVSSNLREIGNFAFHSCSSLEEIVLPETLESIGNRVFYGCDSLREIKIPDSVTYMGDDVFTNSPNLVVVCNEGSYAAEYVLRNSIPCRIIVPIKPGDINGDGIINVVDLSLLRRYALGFDVEVLGNYDLDGNGVYTSVDLALLKRYMLGI